MSSEQKDGSHIVEAILGGSVVQAETYAKFLSESHLQADQLVSINNANFPSLNIGGATVPVLFAMPNRWSLYTFKLPKQAFERHPGANPVSVSTFKLGAARLASDEYGQTVLVIDLTPLSTKVSFGNDTVGEPDVRRHSAAQRPRVHHAFPASGEACQRLGIRARLDPARPAGGESGRRTAVEAGAQLHDRAALAGGEQGRLPRAAVSLRSASASRPQRRPLRWRRTSLPGRASTLPAFPVRATITARVEIANDQKTAPWRAIPCLEMNS